MATVRTFSLRTLSYSVLLFLPWHILAAQAQTPNASGPSTPSIQEDLAAAQQGDLPAQLRVAKAYNEGRVSNGITVVRRNYPQALKWFQAASAQGSSEANAWLGSLYLLGHGVGQDLGQATSLIQAAAGAGDPVGLRFAGLMSETGQGVPRSYQKAVAYFAQAVAKKDANSFDRLGMIYLRGLGVKRQPAKAFALFTQGAALGDSWAELNLGEMYFGGRIPHKSDQAKQPNSAPTARNNVQDSPLQPKQKAAPVPDYASALKFYRQSATQGNRVAAYRLGLMYESGTGVTQDYAQAFEYYRQSAHRQYAPALVALGQAHETGRGTGVNLLHAYIAYNLAIEQNDPNAPALLQSLVHKLNAAQLKQAQASLEEYKQQAAQLANND